jgi:hypothetical protein
MCWAILGRKIAGKNLATRDEIFAALQQAWGEIDQQALDRLVEDFDRRCALVQQVGGKSISQYLSSHLEQPKPAGLTMEAEELFTEEDAEIVSFIEAQQRCRWTELQRMMPNHAKSSLEQLYSLLRIGCLNEWGELRQDFGAVMHDAEVAKVYGVPRPTLPSPAGVQKAPTGWVAFSHECERDPAFRVSLFASTKARAAAVSLAWRNLSETDRQTYGAKVQTHPVKPPSKRGR